MNDDFLDDFVCPEKLLTDRSMRITMEIERLITSGADPIDATLTVAEKYDMEVENIAALIHKNVVEKIRVEAARNNSLKGGRKETYLDIFED